VLRWRPRHRHDPRAHLSDRLDLEADEHLRALARASFRGALAATVRTTFSLAPARKRLEAFDAWLIGARAAGFSPEVPEMLLGITDRRLIAWRMTFLGRPSARTANLPLSRLHDVSAVRHGALTGVAFVVDHGMIFEVEAMRGRPLRHFANEVRAAIAEYHAQG
jgi:hypothetical protein